MLLAEGRAPGARVALGWLNVGGLGGVDDASEAGDGEGEGDGGGGGGDGGDVGGVGNWLRRRGERRRRGELW